MWSGGLDVAGSRRQSPGGSRGSGTRAIAWRPNDTLCNWPDHSGPGVREPMARARFAPGLLTQRASTLSQRTLGADDACFSMPGESRGTRRVAGPPHDRSCPRPSSSLADKPFNQCLAFVIVRQLLNELPENRMFSEL